MKQTALTTHRFLGTPLSRAEEALLRDEAYDLTQKGEARTGDAKLRLAENVLFAFNMLSRVWEFAKPDRSKPGWQAFRAAIRIRDRITHPKSGAESRLTQKDIDTIQKARE
jgi:hypothetical protein